MLFKAFEILVLFTKCFPVPQVTKNFVIVAAFKCFVYFEDALFYDSFIKKMTKRYRQWTGSCFTVCMVSILEGVMMKSNMAFCFVIRGLVPS